MRNERQAVAGLLAAAAVIFGVGIHWGLPSRASDRFLLREQQYAPRIERMTAEIPEVDAKGGADVVAAAGPAESMVPLGVTDTQKAQILCRYRLYSFQPDEMITFRALSRMNPGKGDFDPRLYQYGGLWIYGVAATIEAGKVLGLVNVADRATYIGNPELFGEFYVAARGYGLAWGLAAVWAVYVIARRLSGPAMALMAGLCFAAMPVVVVTAHEAKPHLAGAALVLLTAASADKFVQTRKKRWMWISGVLCGAAAGMVLWGAVALVVIAVIALLVRKPRAFVWAGIAAVGVYALSNPYVIYHLAVSREALRSNLGNTQAMYGLGRPDLAVWRSLQLIVAGCGPAVLAVGVIGAARAKRTPMVIILAAVGIAAAVVFAAMAAGKPGEYGRFFLLPDGILLLLGAAGFRGKRLCGKDFLRPSPQPSSATADLRPGVPGEGERGSGAGSLATIAGTLAVTAVFGGICLAGFWRDAGAPEQTSRWKAAVELQDILETRTAQEEHLRRMGENAAFEPTLGVYADPAPYGLPPVDLNGWRIVRLAPGSTTADVIVVPTESIWQTDFRNPISWADKQFKIWEH